MHVCLLIPFCFFVFFWTCLLSDSLHYMALRVYYCSLDITFFSFCTLDSSIYQLIFLIFSHIRYGVHWIFFNFLFDCVYTNFCTSKEEKKRALYAFHWVHFGKLCITLTYLLWRIGI